MVTTDLGSHDARKGFHGEYVEQVPLASQDGLRHFFPDCNGFWLHIGKLITRNLAPWHPPEDVLAAWLESL